VDALDRSPSSASARIPALGLKQNLMAPAACKPKIRLVPGRPGTSASKAASARPPSWGRFFLVRAAPCDAIRKGRQLKRPHSLGAFIGVLISLILPQRGQTNTCAIACSAATSVDLDQAIGMLQASQIGEDKCSIDCLNLSMERQFPADVLAPTAN
jgi:hypothetical protein